MIFGIFRWIKRKTTIILLLIAVAVLLKQAYPTVGRQIGEWISGTRESPFVQAVSSMVSSLSEGDGLKAAVEVFRETVQNTN